jgi:hypothetical protein
MRLTRKRRIKRKRRWTKTLRGGAGQTINAEIIQVKKDLSNLQHEVKQLKNQLQPQGPLNHRQKGSQQGPLNLRQKGYHNTSIRVEKPTG